MIILVKFISHKLVVQSLQGHAIIIIENYFGSGDSMRGKQWDRCDEISIGTVMIRLVIFGLAVVAFWLIFVTFWTPLGRRDLGQKIAYSFLKKRIF